MSDPRADQMRAAVAHARRAFFRQPQALGGQPQRPGFVAAFLTRLAQRHREAIAANDGGLLCCEHIASGSPVAHVVAAWRPGTALCTCLCRGQPVAYARR
jgi:hypothetical protein